MAEVTRSPKHWYQWPDEKDFFPQKIKIKKIKTAYFRLCSFFEVPSISDHLQDKKFTQRQAHLYLSRTESKTACYIEYCIFVRTFYRTFEFFFLNWTQFWWITSTKSDRQCDFSLVSSGNRLWVVTGNVRVRSDRFRDGFLLLVVVFVNYLLKYTESSKYWKYLTFKF